jgi:Lectin C-type domain
VLAASGCAAAATAVGVACIPDLPANEAEAGTDAGSRCGDGIIQLALGEQCDPGAATSTTCAGCRVTCAPDLQAFVWSGNNHCYWLDTHLATSLDQEAVAYCGTTAHVVTFASEDELSAVVTHLEAGSFWVGLDPVDPALAQPNEYTSLQLFEPGWSPTCSGCFAHTPTPTQPLPGATQGCVQAQSDLDASWQQSPCSDAGKLHVVCEREPVGVLSQRCDAGVCIDLAWTFGQKQYVYVSHAMTGDQAQQACFALGGTLVVLESRDEREQLWRELSHMPGVANPPTETWIGLALTDAGWAWANDAAADAYPSPWGDKQPKGNGSRAYLLQSTAPPPLLDTTLARNDEVSLTPYPFVCQLPGSADSGP